jgi:hypothetical protein
MTVFVIIDVMGIGGDPDSEGRSGDDNKAEEKQPARALAAEALEKKF